MSADPIQVKAYLDWTNNPTEIRRFSVDSDASTNYEYLLEKIRSVYPSLKRENIQLFWKDEDEEIITFSSDEELIEALTHIQGIFFRVYVKEVKKSGQNTADEEGVVHSLVSCDGCEGKVVGSRFKCSVCPDYDLCSSCESKGLHAQHFMIRIRNPGTTPSFPWFNMNMPWMQHGRHMGRGPCGGRRGGPWRAPPHAFRRGHGGWPGFPQGPPTARGPSACSSGSNDGQATGEASQAPGEASQAPGEASQAGQTKKEGQTMPEGEPTHLFHQFGEVLNAFLGPYGVDVHTYVGSNEGQDEQRNQDDDQSGKCGQHKEKENCPTSPNPPETKPKTCVNAKDNCNEEPMDEASSPLNGDHTYVVVGTTQHDGKNEEQDLAKAVERMKAMGFEDEGGWISRLLKEKNYDINKFLDSIHQPQMKK